MRVAVLHDNIARHASLDDDASVALVNQVRDLVKRITVNVTGKGRDAQVSIIAKRSRRVCIGW